MNKVISESKVIDNNHPPLEGGSKSVISGRGYKKISLSNSKTLRKNTTDAEKLLWYYIKKEQLGVKFRRQQPIDKYIVDFFCPEKKLIIELDGSQHNKEDKIIKDKSRNKFLENNGYKILRFWNNEIIDNMEGCLIIINKMLNSSPHPIKQSPLGLPLKEGVIEKSQSKKKVVIIGGPTASGKSSVAKELALKENGVIINCDSMQVYDVLNIITARPSKEDEKEVEHRLYGYISPEINCNADMWRKQALIEIDNVISQGKLPIIVGGTGMYIKSLIEGLSPIPKVPDSIRKEARDRTKEEGCQILYKEISEDDKNRLSENDSQRICRAYEVFKATGKSMTWWNSQENIGIRKDLDFEIKIIMPEMDKLYEKCNGRFEQMIEQGALEEVKKLMEMNLDSNLPVMKAIGVPEMISYLKNKISLEEAIDKAQQSTRRYAKRQKTWFKKLM